MGLVKRQRVLYNIGYFRNKEKYKASAKTGQKQWISENQEETFMKRETVIVLDFGGQYNQLIARRVRECNVYCEIYSYKTDLEKIKAMEPKGIIFTGGPNSVYLDDSPHVDPDIFTWGVPILGINFGRLGFLANSSDEGVVAVAAGDGLAAVFRDLGADGVISGGQTMNPSTDDILREIDATPAEVVFVLPNNKNIIMAAEQCVRLVEGKQVVVLPTKTIPQGISALMVMDPEAEVEDNRAAMAEAIGCRMAFFNTGEYDPEDPDHQDWFADCTPEWVEQFRPS